MALSEKQMSHPRFWAFQNLANEAVVDAAARLGFTTKDLSEFDVQAGRVVDDLTALFLRIENAKQR